jgi:hypothetical protein
MRQEKIFAVHGKYRSKTERIGVPVPGIMQVNGSGAEEGKIFFSILKSSAHTGGNQHKALWYNVCDGEGWLVKANRPLP